MRIAFGSDEKTALTDAVAADLEARGHELVLVGTETMPFMDAAADSLVTNLPRAEKRAVEASDHRWEPRSLALVIAEFLVG